MRSLLTRLFTLLAAGALACASALPASARPAAPASGTITGRVTAANSGAGLSGINVVQYSVTAPFPGVSTLTDAQGFYTLTIGSDAVKLFFEDFTDTYVSLWYGGLPYRQPLYSSGPPWRDAKVLTTTSDLSNINIALPTGSAIAGIVTDDDTGEPIFHAPIKVTLASGRDFETLSGSDGRYTVRGLLPGPLRLYIDSPEVIVYNTSGQFTDQPYLGEFYPDAAQIETAAPITLTQGSTKIVDLDLKRGAVITGTVRSFATGQALLAPDYAVLAINCLSVRDTKAEALDYKVLGVAPAPTKLWIGTSNPGDWPTHYVGQAYNDKPFSAPDLITPTLGVTLTDINVALRIANKLTVTLIQDSQVISISSGYSRLTVETNLPPTPASNSGTFMKNGAISWALADGVYWIRHAGDERFAPGYFPSGADIGSALPVTLTGGESKWITFTQSSSMAAGFISGRVTAADTRQPLQGSSVSFYQLLNPRFIATVSTDANGLFTSTKLVPGSYAVYVSGVPQPSSGAPYAGEFSGDAAAIGSAQPVTVTANATETANFALELGTVITGRVVASDTQVSLTKVAVRVFDAQGHQLVFGSNSGTTSTGADGVFRTLPIKPGRYRIAFDEKPLYRYPDCAVMKTYQSVVYPGVATLAQGTPVTLDGGGALSLTQQMSDEANTVPTPAPTLLPPTATPPTPARKFVYVPVIRK
jgi:hypothetical protein